VRQAAEIVSPEARRAALEQVLGSRTFDRSDQLKAFLRFVCESEMAGRGSQLNEYQIGVDVLGRPADYQPAEDAIVRNRAYTLRRKLEEYYSHENPGARVRIEIPRGGYAPRFFVEEEHPEPRPPDSTPPAPKRTRHTGLWWMAVGAILASLAWWLIRGPDPVAPVLREAWGPLVARTSHTMVHVSAPLHLFVRPNPTRVPGDRPEVDRPVLRDWYRQFPSLPPAEELYLRPTPNSLLWGDAAGMVAVSRVLSAGGVAWEVAPARVAGEPILRRRNAILFGRPEYSRVAAKLLQNTPLTVEFHSGLREYGVQDRQSGEWWLPKYVANDEAEVVYGLVTVLASEGSPGGEHRTVLLTGTNSAGTQAAAEFFCSAREMAALKERLGGFPAAYQVVVRATASATIALDIFYEQHRVLK
jgi:hypothetical protein